MRYMWYVHIYFWGLPVIPLWDILSSPLSSPPFHLQCRECVVICFPVCSLVLQPWGQRAPGSLSFIQTHTTWTWISLHNRNSVPPIQTSVRPYAAASSRSNLPPALHGLPCRRSAAHPGAGQMLPPPSQHFSRFQAAVQTASQQQGRAPARPKSL